MAPSQYIVAEMKEFGVPTWRTGSIPFFGMAEGPQLWDHCCSARLYWQRAVEENEARALVVVSRYSPFPETDTAKDAAEFTLEFLSTLRETAWRVLVWSWVFFRDSLTLSKLSTL